MLVAVPLFLSVVSFPVGVEMRSNCESFMSEAMLTPRPVVHLYSKSSLV